MPQISAKPTEGSGYRTYVISVNGQDARHLKFLFHAKFNTQNINIMEITVNNQLYCTGEIFSCSIININNALG
jgi:glycine cleavage system regulatory protein